MLLDVGVSPRIMPPINHLPRSGVSSVLLPQCETQPSPSSPNLTCPASATPSRPSSTNSTPPRANLGVRLWYSERASSWQPPVPLAGRQRIAQRFSAGKAVYKNWEPVSTGGTLLRGREPAVGPAKTNGVPRPTSFGWDGVFRHPLQTDFPRSGYASATLGT